MAPAGGRDTQTVIKIPATSEKQQQKKQKQKRLLLTELQVWTFIAKFIKEISDEFACRDRRKSRARTQERAV